jgi:endonuclease/exonuclease/phosphatase family metal-dependent hydrolase
VVAVSAAALTAVACLALPAAAQTGASKLTPPAGIHLVNVSASSFTVASKAASGAKGYRMYVSRVKGDLYHGRMSAARVSRLYSTPTLSMKNLPYTATPYFYRLVAINGTRRSFSPIIGSVGLQPATPTNLQVSATATGTSLTWDSGPATGYSIVQSTDLGMAADRHTYTITGGDTQFTPYGLTSGTTYYFEVAALNSSTPSLYTPTVSAVAMTSEQKLSVMTYNILELTADGHAEGDGTIAPWSQRIVGAVALIHKADPDVIAIQEGTAWVGKVRGPRQVDSLVDALNGEYTLATTEVPPSQPKYFRTGDYILYKTSDYTAVGAGNHWALGGGHFAAYQVLQDTQSGAQFLMVAPHLIVGNGAAMDQAREDETNSMLTQAAAFDQADALPIVYAGDFNTDITPAHAFDGPGIAMRAARVNDAYDVAQTQINTMYNSANGYFRKPPPFGDHIDYVFAPLGVAVESVRLLLNLSGGKFVGVIPSDHNPVLATLDIPWSSS